MASQLVGRTLSRKTCQLAKFEGALVGAVLGDCMGAKFEYRAGTTHEDIVGFFQEIKDSPNEALSSADSSTVLSYTDDTAMTRCIAASLIEHKQFKAKDLAYRFSEEYFKEPGRGYGRSVKTLFKQLKQEHYKEPFGPASRSFDGKGSYGNGGAMRISPAALYGYNMDDKDFNELISGITRITHSAASGINGAILEAQAVRQALWQQEGEPLDQQGYIRELRAYMEDLEGGDQDGDTATKPYCDKLDLIQDYCNIQEVSKEVIINTLGNDVSALESVPAAIYCFIKGLTPIEGIEASSHIERSVIYAVTLGGDTDTIASMAGAIVGAYVGLSAMPEMWLERCEGVDEAIRAAKQLWSISQELDAENVK